MRLKPWYKVGTPREDLREGKLLDDAEFAVHLDDVRNNCTPPHCCRHLLASQVRLSGFAGGKA